MIIQSSRVWIAGTFTPAQIEIQRKKITAIHTYGSKTVDIDYQTLRILPGFIDLHTHGAYGYDTNDGTEQGLLHWIEHIPEEGVTALLPTTVTQMPDILYKAVKNVAAVIERQQSHDSALSGAEILGIHFEGPFLDMEYKGAQPAAAIARPDVVQFENYQKAAKGWIRYITLSPEHDKDFSLTRHCQAEGVTVSIGHSSATYEEAVLAAANGATSMTHVFNGMRPFHHRTPGLTGAALTLPNVYGEIIADGNHSHLAALKLFFQAKGNDHAILVSDSLCAKHGTQGADYQLGGQAIRVGEDGLARLSGTDTIAGSTLAINEGLRILIEEAGISPHQAINACTLNPAKCLGIHHRKGKIQAGFDADLVILKDNYAVHTTFCRGVIKFCAEE
ncbi:MAG: N-acetylglucosamine-6-phosphate deacetylase [Blautia sp.]|nr:N-acetylglucosamine-6-phosphate deacetylase [Blautia sp.]